MDYYPPIDWARHRLHAAAFSGKANEIRQLITDGAEVNENVDMDIDGRQDVAGSPLHVAIRIAGEQHLDAIEALLDAGADVRSQRKWDGTPLHDAARLGLIRVAELLIAAGANVDSKEDAYRRTPLQVAAAHGRLEMVDYLLSCGASIDELADWNPPRLAPIRFPRGRAKTALQAAAEMGHPTVVKRLLDAGARIDDDAIKLAREAKQQSNNRFDTIIALLST